MAWKWKHSPKDQLEDVGSLHAGLTGLQNLENTCYMNAVLQCLCSLTPLVQYFLSGKWNTDLHEWVGLFTVLRAFCLALFSFQRICVAMGMSKAPASFSQAVLTRLVTSWFPSLRAQLVSLPGPSAWYFPCHIDGNTHYCWLSRWCFLPLGSAESLKPTDSCQSCTVPASVLCVSVSYPIWRQTLFFLISPETLPFFPREIGESATAFACLVSDMWLGEFDYVSPEAFHSVFGKRYPTFSRRTQHDAQEFLICVLDDLHEAFKEVRAQLWCFGSYSCFLCISWLSIPCNNCLSSSSELHDGARITLLFYLYFIPMYTQLLTFFLSNAPPNCSPNLNDNAGVASLLPLLDLSTLNVLQLSHLPEKFMSAMPPCLSAFLRYWWRAFQSINAIKCLNCCIFVIFLSEEESFLLCMYEPSSKVAAF